MAKYNYKQLHINLSDEEYLMLIVLKNQTGIPLSRMLKDTLKLLPGIYLKK